MSRVMTLNGDQIQFVLNDDTEDINTEGLSDIIYSDGTRAILVNSTGHIIQSNDGQAVVIQDDELNQYYINNENGEIIAVTDEQDLSIGQSFEEAEVVQCIEEDGTITAEPQIIYVNEEGYAINDSDLSQYQITEVDDGGDNLLPLSPKTMKLETQVVDLDELIRQQESQSTIIDNEANGYQFAILKDGKLHIQSYTGDIFPITTTDVLQEPGDTQQLTEQQELDLSRITGRNLLTGQTVTLQNYMDKLQKNIKNTTKTTKWQLTDPVPTHRRKTSSVSGLKGLLNKKLTLGKTSSGKRLVGKVIHVEKRVENGDANAKEDLRDIESNVLAVNEKLNLNESTQQGRVEENDSPLEFDENELTSFTNLELTTKTPHVPIRKPTISVKKKVVVQEKLVSKECFGHICRTLSGLMNMESVKKKLQYKNIIVRVVERKYEEATEEFTKKVSYSSGHMQEEFIVNDEGEMLENWSFISDTNIKASILGSDQEGEDDQDAANKYLESTSITLIITQDKTNHRSIRVILNPSNVTNCSICDKEFRNNLQLRLHLLHAHTQQIKICEVCSLQFDDLASFDNHRAMHVDEGKLFRCTVEKCGKFFLTNRKLQRHKSMHNITSKPLECSVCLQRCSSESALKKHLITHMNVKNLNCDSCGKRFNNLGDLNFHRRVHDPLKYYGCDICKRTFSRHSNLLRHIEIHKGSEELYQCTICGSSYHYMSSLTRHVVQNHIRRPDAETTPVLMENDAEDF